MKYKNSTDIIFHPFLLRDKNRFCLEQPGDSEIHVWSTSLEIDEDNLKNLKKNLSVDELMRADRFDSDLHRRRFVVARSNLRMLLAGYLNCEISAIEFAYKTHGKPALKKPRTELTFNLSHSHDLALYGFGVARAIGIDVERERKDLSELAIAKRFFSQDEIEKIAKLFGENRRKAFFSCWTRKEAYLKACGVGISGGLKSFSVSCGHDEEVKLIKGNGIENWEVVALTPASRYAAAICFEGKGIEINCRCLIEE